VNADPVTARFLADLLGNAWAVFLIASFYAGFRRHSIPWMQGLLALSNASATLAFLLYELWLPSLPFAFSTAVFTVLWWFTRRPAPVKEPRPGTTSSTDWLARPYADRDACWGCGLDPELTDEEREELRRRKGEAVPACEWCGELIEALEERGEPTGVWLIDVKG
jgi:hypothetical protein